jgi:predicted  nucleic acid-binding Zn-ribbon protein
MSDEQTKPRENYMERTVRLTAELTALQKENEHKSMKIDWLLNDSKKLLDENKSLREQVEIARVIFNHISEQNASEYAWLDETVEDALAKLQ